jgi:hypothetical protein
LTHHAIWQLRKVQIFIDEVVEVGSVQAVIIGSRDLEIAGDLFFRADIAST